jgi:2',3'-cyclic-nucleotide 2'-phosphodiesterase/3'-nucleotidase
VIREVSPTPKKTDKPAKPAKAPERRVAKRGAVEKPLSHAVRSGENLYRISLRYGVDLDALFAANPGIDPHKLRIGQPVVIPRAEPLLAHRD